MEQKTVLVGVTGGIAAYKALDVVSKLKKQKYDVHVIMTKHACEFVTPLSFEALSGNPVINDMFNEPKAWEIQHISLAKKADLIIVVPATANVIGKVAAGLADDMLTTTLMAATCKKVFATAMNVNMYKNEIVQENIQKLKSYGYEFIDPAEGMLACGDVGVGKLEQTDIIAEKVEGYMYSKKDLQGKRVLITAGPTIAKIDPVRFITNHSSGKMGYELAKEARDRGALVTLVSGPSSLKKPYGMEFIPVETTEEMYNAVIGSAHNQDIIIKNSAVADFMPEHYSENKIKKTSDSMNIKLVKGKDILAELGRQKGDYTLVGFAAESENLISNAKRKIDKKNLDYIIVNDISREDAGFKSDTNEAVMISSGGEEYLLGKTSKREMAGKIFDNIMNGCI